MASFGPPPETSPQPEGAQGRGQEYSGRQGCSRQNGGRAACRSGYLALGAREDVEAPRIMRLPRVAFLHDDPAISALRRSDRLALAIKLVDAHADGAVSTTRGASPCSASSTLMP